MRVNIDAVRGVLPGRYQYCLSDGAGGRRHTYTWPCGCRATGTDQYAPEIIYCSEHAPDVRKMTLREFLSRASESVSTVRSSG